MTQRYPLGPNPISMLALWLILMFYAAGAAAQDPEINTATTRESLQGIFVGTLNTGKDAVRINQLNSWVLHVKTPAGQPLDAAEIKISGGMPAHQHGLPTAPRVTQNLGGGNYLVEGIKFQMGGHWVLDFQVRQEQLSDTIRFEFVL